MIWITRAVWGETFKYGSVRGLGWNSPCLLDYERPFYIENRNTCRSDTIFQIFYIDQFDKNGNKMLRLYTRKLLSKGQGFYEGISIVFFKYNKSNELVEKQYYEDDFLKFKEHFKYIRNENGLVDEYFFNGSPISKYKYDFFDW